MKAIKNVLSLVIIMCMLAGCFTFTALAAETVTISVEKAVPGYPVNVTVDSVAVTTETVTYYVSDTEDGEYTLVDGASGNGWQITNACAKKYIKAEVDGVKSNAIKVGAGASVNTTYWTPYGTVKDSPQQYTVKLAEPSNSSVYYQLLDTETVDGEKQYLFLQQGKHATSGKVKVTDTDTKWNPEEALTLAYWLDKIWKTDDMQGGTYYKKNGGIFYDSTGTMTKMDPALRSYLVDDKTWLTERDEIHILNDYTFKAGVTILSIAEYKKYYDKIGMSGIVKSWFRTPEKDSTKQRQRLWYATDSYSDTSGKLQLAGATTGVSSNFRAYPIFYLTEDFFKNVKLDLEKTGSDVKSIIKEHNSIATLRRIGYTDDEIRTIGFDPDKEGVTISVEKAVPGYPVNVTADGTAVTTQEVTYYVSEEEDGEYTTPIDGASGNGWQITNACAGKFIKAEVNGVKSNAIKVGAGVTRSSSWQHGAAIVKPTQYSFRIADSTVDKDLYYQLLDSETVDGEKQYLVLQVGSVLNGKICTDSTNTKWDPTLNSADVKHLAYWLENYWSKGLTTNEVWTGTGASSKVMEKALRAYVPERTWLTERSAAIANDYTFRAHATILSIQEVRNYKDRLYKDDIDKMFMRSGHMSDTEDKRAYSYVNSNNIGAIKANTSGASYKVMPAFYVTEDFFKKVKLDLKATGSDVRALILEHNDEAALTAIGYTDAELAELGVIPKISAEITALKNESGAALEKGGVTGTAKLTAEYTVTNNMEEAQAIKGIIAVFEGKTLANIILGDINAESGTNTYTVTLEGLDTAKTYTAKIMVWEDLKTLIPLCAMTEY